MVLSIFSKFTEKRFGKLGQSKLKPLHNFEPVTHRLQVAQLQAQRIECVVLDVGHRRDIYC